MLHKHILPLGRQSPDKLAQKTPEGKEMPLEYAIAGMLRICLEVFSFVCTRTQKCADACAFVVLWVLSAALSKAPLAEMSRCFRTETLFQ